MYLANNMYMYMCTCILQTTCTDIYMCQSCCTELHTSETTIVSIVPRYLPLNHSIHECWRHAKRLFTMDKDNTMHMYMYMYIYSIYTCTYTIYMYMYIYTLYICIYTICTYIILPRLTISLTSKLIYINYSLYGVWLRCGYTRSP